ncbi:MAG: TRASH domain-containing protein [Candidatus Omnitrophota bacterium]
MLKKKLILMSIVLFMFGRTTFSFAQMKCPGHSGGSGHKYNSSDSVAQNSQKMTVEVGNKVCPVLNGKIDEKTKAIFEYKEKIYNFCCPACIDDFKKYPDKYIKKAEEELKGAS